MPPRRTCRRKTALLLALVAGLAGIAYPETTPWDPTGSTWTTTGRAEARLRGRRARSPITLDVEFLPDRVFRATDDSGLALTGPWSALRAHGRLVEAVLEPGSVAAIESALHDELEPMLGEPIAVVMPRHRVRARVNRTLDRLALKVKLQFEVTLEWTDRLLRVRERIRTRTPD